MTVILTEKPSVARDIAQFLGAKKRCEGYFEGNGYQVTWAYGHLLTLKEPEDYDEALKRWRIDTLPIIPEKFGLKVLPDKGVQKQFKVIKALFKSAKDLICATDAGREGELIFRYILTMTGSDKKPVRRLWLNALTEEALQEGFAHLRPGEDLHHLYQAARCRSESDWIVGLNATRNMTIRYGASQFLWSVGRVQTPVLAMIVDKDTSIRIFIPEPFWEVLTKYRDTIFSYKGKRFLEQSKAELLLKSIEGHPLTVQDVNKKKETVLPPQLFDLTELQREMNRRYGTSAAETLNSAQKLYEQKLLTYPRTDSRYLGSSLKKEVPGILKALGAGELNVDALKFTKRIVDDSKVTDHHAIIPTGRPPQQLPPQEKQVFEAVHTRLIAAFYPPCIKEMTTVDAEINATAFQAKGVCIVDPGWTVLYPKKEDEQILASFEVGETGPHKPYLKEGKTKAPKQHTENSLLGAMETAGKNIDEEALREAIKDKGIGTPSTRAAIIETLLKRGYIRREKKSLIPTDSGRYLIALIQDPSLKSAEMTGHWESQLKQIEQGTLNPDEFMKNIAQFTRGVLESSDVTRIDLTIYGRCPCCQHPVIKGKRGYGCSQWKEGCSFVLWNEYKSLTFSDTQARQLLQHGILLPPIRIGNDEPFVLSLSSQGKLLEITLPKATKKYYHKK